MKKRPYIKDILITILILLLSFGISLILQSVFTIHEHITAIFIFAVSIPMPADWIRTNDLYVP